MQPEDVLLTAFVLLPIASIAALVILLRRTRASRTRRRWPRLFFGNVLVLASLCSLTLLGGELYYRFAYDTTDSFGLTKVSRRWFERHFALNKEGFRDSFETYRRAPLPGTRRVTFIGDSFTAGHGVANVADRFVDRVRARHPEWEVHMFAGIGGDTGAELQSVQALLGYKYALDVVVLVYCLNDVSDLVPEWQATLARTYASGEPGYLVQHSYFVNTLYWRWRVARDPKLGDYYRSVLGAYDGALWDEQQRRLTELAQTVEGARGRLVVVTFPFLHALGPEYPYRGIHAKLDACWRRLGVPHLDLLELYNKRESAELVVNRRDPHPNELAHALAADAIDAFLVETMAATAPTARVNAR